MYGIAAPPTAGSINLQATVASSSSMQTSVSPHHPITCSTGDLRYYEDGSMSCQHAVTPAADERTQACVNHSIAILLLELARENY